MLSISISFKVLEAADLSFLEEEIFQYFDAVVVRNVVKYQKLCTGPAEAKKIEDENVNSFSGQEEKPFVVYLAESLIDGLEKLSIQEVNVEYMICLVQWHTVK